MGIIEKLQFELCTLERQVPSCYSSAISRISAQGLRIVCHLLYMQHWKRSPLLGWFFPLLVLLLPLSPCFCSSKCLFRITCKRYSPNNFSLAKPFLTQFFSYRKLRERDSTRFHIQLCIALFCMLIIFVSGINQTSVYGGCVFVSVLIHYFTLVAMMWMGAEAVLMFQKLVIVFTRITTRYIIAVSLVCWCKWNITVSYLASFLVQLQDAFLAFKATKWAWHQM